MSIKGGPHQRFRRALEIGRLPLVLSAAAELPRLGLADALEVLLLIADQDPRALRAGGGPLAGPPGPRAAGHDARRAAAGAARPASCCRAARRRSGSCARSPELDADLVHQAAVPVAAAEALAPTARDARLLIAPTRLRRV